jgi:hypothetical protein
MRPPDPEDGRLLDDIVFMVVVNGAITFVVWLIATIITAAEAL